MRTPTDSAAAVASTTVPIPSSSVAPGGISSATVAPIATSAGVGGRPTAATGTGGPSTTARISPGMGGAS
jgi:hypothetical protein